MDEAAASLRILVADDDGEARALMVSMLESLGHDVVAELGTGRDAVAFARSHLPDLVLLDVHMPDGSGIDAAKEINAILPTTAVVLFTGDETLRLSEVDVRESAAISILTKPTPKRTLDSALRLAAARAREMTAAQQEATSAKQALEERKLIERAKGILQRRGITEAEAYRVLQRSSQDRSVPMVTVAREVIASEPTR